MEMMKKKMEMKKRRKTMVTTINITMTITKTHLLLLVGDLKNAPLPDFLMSEESRTFLFSLKFLLLTPGMPRPPPIPAFFFVASDFCSNSALPKGRTI